MIESFWELFKESIVPINLPFTVLLLGAIGYWMLMLLGMVDLDMPDADMPDVDAAGHGSHSLQAVLSFLHIGDAPMMVVLSFMALIAWTFAITVNYFFNPGSSGLLALVFLVPNAVTTCVLTHYLMRPVARIMRNLNSDMEKVPDMVGQVGVVSTSEVTAKFGVASIEVKGAPLSVQVRNLKDEPIKKGDKVLIVTEDKQNNLFSVVKFNQNELEG